MRRAAMLGTALMVVGGTVFLRGLSSPTTHEEMGMDDASVSAEARNPMTPWAAGLAVIGGLVLVTTGTRRKA